MRRWASKVDDNHAEVVAGLRALGVWVWSCAAAGGGGPDLLCCWRGVWVPLEVKMPLGPKGGSAHASLTAKETALRDSCPAPWAIVRSVEEAWDAVRTAPRPLKVTRSVRPEVELPDE